MVRETVYGVSVVIWVVNSSQNAKTVFDPEIRWKKVAFVRQRKLFWTVGTLHNFFGIDIDRKSDFTAPPYSISRAAICANGGVHPKKVSCQNFCRCQKIYRVFKDKWLFPRTHRVKKITVKFFVDAEKFTECFKILKRIFFSARKWLFPRSHRVKMIAVKIFIELQKIYVVFQDLKSYFFGVRTSLFPRAHRVKKIIVKFFVDSKKFMECSKISKSFFLVNTSDFFHTLTG